MRRPASVLLLLIASLLQAPSPARAQGINTPAQAQGINTPARAQGVYRIDQRFGGIEFTVSDLGLFSSHGMFDRFMGQLVIDPTHPEKTAIAVDVDASSIAMPWEDAAAMLRSADFFDVAQYPSIRFTSTGVERLGPDRYRILGQLRIRGVTQPQTLDAQLQDRRTDPSKGVDVADFVVSGALRRSDFGMVADQTLISNTVAIRIHARVVLDHAAPG
jgi:polyisoprenoid-binding protein YceI